MTLVEVLVALGLSVLVSVLCHRLWSTSRRGVARSAATIETAQGLRLASMRLSRELREALRIFYPCRQGQTADGVGYVDERGRPVMIHTGPGAAGPTVVGEAGPAPGIRARPLRLWMSRLDDGSRKLLLEEVNHFRVTLHPVPPGQEPSFVTLKLSVIRPSPGGAPPHAQGNVTTIQLRNVERSAPDV